jgi:pimeloyl-ACP methyl ester carboxylesterase
VSGCGDHAPRLLSTAAALVAAGLVAVGLSACDGSDDWRPIPFASGPVIETAAGTATPYGEGAGQVWVLRPRRREVKSVVVYLHGYGAYLPFEWHLEWMDHLLDAGNAVLFPRYQRGSTDDPWILTPFDLATGLETGFRALRYRGEPVAAGFSLGATLAAVYAARAKEWNVPAPESIYAVFPVDPILVDLALDLSALPDTTRVLVVAGEDDDVAGVDAAREFLGLLRGLPAEQKELRLVAARGDLPADHDAPTLANRPVVRETYWYPLDRLVAAAREG